MNSRERVLMSLNHKQPDRVPIDLSGHRSSGISAIAYSKLRSYLGFEEKPIRVYDMVQQLAIVDDDMLDYFDIDVIEMGRGFCLEDKDWKDWVLPDGTCCQIPYYINVEKRGDHWYLLADDGTELGVQTKGCLYFEQTHFPLLNSNIQSDDFSQLEEALAHTIWTGAVHPGAHLPLNDEGLSVMSEKARTLRESTGRAIVGLFGGNMFELPQWLYRMDNFLMYMRLYPDAVGRLLDKLCSLHLSNLEKWMGAVGPYIDVICFGDDLGGQNGPLISPTMYREVLKPYHRKLWNRAKELGDVKVMLHCCGSISELLEDFIDAGLDAINPVQISCKNMDASKLKTRFGDRLVFWGGGCDTRDVLPNASHGKIVEHTKRHTEIFNVSGGFVFQQVHNIMANVPPGNICAMYDAINTDDRRNNRVIKVFEGVLSKKAIGESLFSNCSCSKDKQC